MKDKATAWLMGLNPFDKVKGHTKIELTDVKTGKKQVIEKDNAFQAGVLASYMRSMGAYNNNPYANSTWAGQPIWRNLCGGIFCFKDPIDNSEDEVEYMPAGNEMVANGAYMVNNAGTPIELGSYNEVESSTSGNDSVTFVYDWMTHQGNGTISCVCLSTEIGGYIGYGNKSGGQASTKGFSTNQSSRALKGFAYGNYRYVFSNLDTTNKTITVTRYPIEITKGSIFDNIAEDSYTITYTGNNPSWYMSGGDAIPIGNGKCIVFFTGGYNSGWIYINNGTVFTPFMVIDLVNNTAHTVTLTNTTGTILHITIYGSNGCYAIDENYAFWQSDANAGGNGHTYKIKYTQSTDTWTDMGAIGNWQPQQPSPAGGIIVPQMLHMLGRIYDTVNGTLYPMNGREDRIRYNPEQDALSISSVGGRDEYNGTYLVKNPLILSTVNNLETPVTKTAAQTMKITYTLSKASE